MPNPIHSIDNIRGIHATLAGCFRIGRTDEEVIMYLVPRLKVSRPTALALTVSARSFAAALAAVPSITDVVSLHATLSGYLRIGWGDSAIACGLVLRRKIPYEIALALATSARAFDAALRPFGATLTKSPPLPERKTEFVTVGMPR